jgi:hypothetical protein
VGELHIDPRGRHSVCGALRSAARQPRLRHHRRRSPLCFALRRLLRLSARRGGADPLDGVPPLAGRSAAAAPFVLISSDCTFSTFSLSLSIVFFLREYRTPSSTAVGGALQISVCLSVPLFSTAFSAQSTTSPPLPPPRSSSSSSPSLHRRWP